MKKTLILLLVAGTVGLATIALMADEDDERHQSHEREHYGERDYDDDHDDDHERYEHASGSGSAYLSDPQHALYKAECGGGCHMAYPPTMLPTASWRAMMGSLEDHFGDNAELDATTGNQIMAYLTRHAATKGRGKYGERSWRATRGGPPPLRITETDYFRGQHHEIPHKMVEGNPDVGSYSRCETCHGGADRGDFDEHRVRIPGYGRWDD